MITYPFLLERSLSQKKNTIRKRIPQSRIPLRLIQLNNLPMSPLISLRAICWLLARLSAVQ